MSADELQQLYTRIDTEATRLSAVHGDRLTCKRGCSMCCVDDITVVQVEAENIRTRFGDLLAHGQPHEVGMCAFLDDAGACRIYSHRPYVCRSQGVPLRWTDEDEAGDLVELRDICPLNEAGTPIEALPAESCWSIGWAETALAQLQSSLDGRDDLAFDEDFDDEDFDNDDIDAGAQITGARVALRELFSSESTSAPGSS